MDQSSHLQISNAASAVVTGAGHGIGLAFIKKLTSLNKDICIYATFNDEDRAIELSDLQAKIGTRLNLQRLKADVEDDYHNLHQIISSQHSQIDLVINCIGSLHDSAHQPEKRLQDITVESLVDSFKINAAPVAMLAKHLFPLLKNPSPSLFASLSARVGSIGDNRSGGWYSYRASKCAQNMLIRNIALEFERFRCNTLTMALHPGTTDTALSAPFIGKTKYIVHSPDQTAANLIEVMSAKSMAANGQFYDWQGEEVPW